MQIDHRAKFINKDMKVVFINTCLYGSTGRIVRHLETLAKENGFRTWTVSAYERKHRVKYKNSDIVIGTYFDRYFHLLLSRIFGVGGLFSLIPTLRLIRQMKRIEPDIIHLHNLHNAYINLQVLFRYIRKKKIRTIWTLHDCWAFTGRCPHFEMIKCDRWITGCGRRCPYPSNEYPIGYCDNTGFMWRYKKNCYKDIDSLTIVTPSDWLASLVRKSILGCYKTIVINNGIDLAVFHPCYSDIRTRYRIQKKYIVLGVALNWDKRKGIDVFWKLGEALSKDYQIVLVGIASSIGEQTSSDIITIPRTESQEQLVELYSGADVFVNPTREDTFPTVNIESLACGTPVVTFATGGSPEIINDSCGKVVNGDFQELTKAIVDICENKVFSQASCVDRAREFDMHDRFDEYIRLYQQL